MRKRRKGNLLQRMIAVLLSTVLVVGTAEGAVPVNVLAKESVSGNELEITEEGTGAESVGEETKTEPGTEETGWENMEEPGTEEADQEDMEGTVTEEPKQEPMELVTEAEDSEDVGEIDNDEPGYDIDTDQWSLVIKSDTGMANWCNGRTNYQYYKIKNIEIREGVTYIGEDAFNECDKLESITIPSGVSRIGARAFYTCEAITGIELPDTVTSIGEEAFYRCIQLKEIKLPDTVTSIGNGAFNNCFRLESIEIPGGVTEIAAATFAYCSGLKSITMPEDVASIGSSAFTGCKALESIEIPSGVTEIAAATFKDCIALTSITIPDSVTSIGSSAFYGCSALTGITIPDSVTRISEHAFHDCSALTSITIPEGVTSIANFIFKACSSLEKVTIPDSVTSIGMEAFEKCISLTSIEIPSNVNTILNEAFMDCSSLESVIVQPITPPTIAIDVFTGCKFVTERKKGIIVPTESVNQYKSKWSQWSSYITDSSEAKVRKAIEAALQEIKVTNATTEDDLKTAIDEALKEAGIDSSNVTIEVEDFEKTKATISVDGKITGTIKFQIGDINGTVNVNQTINQLENTPAARVAVTKEIVEEVLGGIEVTNDTTKEDLETAIDEALKAALQEVGIDGSSVTATVGELTVTPATVDTEGSVTGTITITSDDAIDTVDVNKTIEKLSGTPAEKVEAAKETVETVLRDIKVSNDTTEDDLKEAIDKALKEAGIDSSDVKVEVSDFTKTEATTTEEGSIRGTITITSGDATDTVDINKTIEKQSGTPAGKVEAVKETVETALKDIKVSNDTTEDDLKEVIDEALKEAGIDSSDVKVEVSDFTKTEATTTEEGSIRGTITITSGDATDTVDINQTIGKLPGTPVAKVEAAKEALEDAVKKAVEEAVKGIVVTDDNAEDIKEQVVELLPEVIVKALDGTGVSLNDIELGEVEVDINSATADSEGSIRVTIPVISTEDPEQTVNAEVLVTTVRDEDAEKAQELIEGAIKDITVSNETTEEDILKEIQDALGDDAVIEGIEEFEKVEATQDAPGSLTLKIRVTVNGKTVYVTINVPIAKLDIRTGVYVRFTDYDKLDDSSTPCYKYTGAAVEPAVEVYNNETLLIPGTDYTIKYRENTKPGNEAGLSVKGKGSFTGGSRRINFTIIPADIDKDTDHPTKMTVVAGTKVAPVIMNGAKKLTTKDYKLEGDGLKNGKYASATADGKPNTLTVTGIGGYEGSSFTIEVTVIKKSKAGKLAVTVDKNFKPVYDGNALNLSSLFKTGTGDEKGVITVTDSKDKAKVLKEGTDFTAVCTSSLVNAGTVKFTVTGMGAYAGSVSKTFKISPLKVTDSSKFSATFDENKAYEYKASGATVDNLVVKYLGGTGSAEDDKVLMQGVDYKVTYSNNKKVSGSKDASLKVTFLGNYKGSSAVTKTFKVVTAKLSAANTKVIIPDKVYGKANKAYKSTPIVTVNGATIKASNYTVSYAWATASEAGDDTKYVSDNQVKITIAEGDSYARVKVTVAPKQTGSYGLADGAAIIGEYYVRKADNAVNLSKARLVTFHSKAGTELKKLEYNGKAFYTPEGNDANAEGAPDDPNAVYVRVLVGSKIVDPSLYDVEWTNATAKGKATVVIRGKGITTVKGTAVGSKNKTISIKSMVLSGKDLRTYMDKAASAVNRLRDMLFKKQ